MNRISKYVLALGLLMWVMSSCVTQKQLTILRDAEPESAEAINAQFETKGELVIRTGDALTIVVSALDEEAVAPYNLPALVFSRPGSSMVQTTPEMPYYIVDEQGDIDFPVLGKLHIAGLKRTEAEQMLKEQLARQVMNPMVQIHHVNAKVSVLGEVNRPGNVSIPTGRLTILEALASAGDLTAYGKRDNVLLTREVNGKLELARINLNSKELYNSPYYYLQQNDVLYVSPNKVRAVSSTNAGLWLSVVSTALSAATIIVTVVKK